MARVIDLSDFQDAPAVKIGSNGATLSSHGARIYLSVEEATKLHGLLGGAVAAWGLNAPTAQVDQLPTKESVLRYAREVLGDPHSVHSWMNCANFFLDGMMPKDFIEFASQDDLRKIMDELSRIDQLAS
jgi:hypothetical protein